MEKTNRTKHVLLIDDDPVTNMINTKIISMNFNFKVTAYTDAREALNQFGHWLKSKADQLPDIIFLDINMPVMDGWTFLSEFEKLPKAVWEQCSLYMLSSSIDKADMDKSMAYKSVKEFISKPITLDKLKMVAIESQAVNKTE